MINGKKMMMIFINTRTKTRSTRTPQSMKEKTRFTQWLSRARIGDTTLLPRKRRNNRKTTTAKNDVDKLH